MTFNFFIEDGNDCDISRRMKEKDGRGLGLNTQ